MHTDSIRRAFMLVGIVTVAWLSLTMLIGGWWQVRAALARTDAADSWASIVRNVGTSARYMTGQAESASAARQASLAPFVGGWAKHGYTLDIAPDGLAEATWRTYFWCTDAGVKPPCDSIADGIIQPGGRALMRFTHVEGDTLYGTVTQTTAPTAMLMPPYPVMLVLQPNGTALLLQGEATAIPADQRRPIDGTMLCGSLGAWRTGVCGA